MNIVELIDDLVADDDFKAEVEDYDGPDASKVPDIWKSVRHLIEPLGGKKLRVYRSVQLKSLKSLDTSKLGVAWSFDEKAAHSWYGGGGDKYLLVADLPVSSVDVWVTARQLIIHTTDEKEIRAEDNATIFLIEIKDKNGVVVKSFNPALKTNTGHGGLFGEKAQAHLVGSSLLDYPRKTLSPALWVYESGEDCLPRLQPELKKSILDKATEELKKFDLKLKGVLLYGGSASYQWREGADVDVSLYVDWPEGVDPEKVQAHFKDIEIPFGGHPVHLYIKQPDQSDMQMEVADAVYDILHDRWLLPPLILPDDFDPDEYFKPFIKEAERKAEALDLKIGELRRSWSILYHAADAIKEARDPNVVRERLDEEKAKLKILIEELAMEFWDTRKRRYALHDALREKINQNLDLGRLERFQEPEVIWKYLDRSGYVDFLWGLYKIYSQGKVDDFLDTY